MQKKQTTKSAHKRTKANKRWVVFLHLLYWSARIIRPLPKMGVIIRASGFHKKALGV